MKLFKKDSMSSDFSLSILVNLILYALLVMVTALVHHQLSNKMLNTMKWLFTFIASLFILYIAKAQDSKWHSFMPVDESFHLKGGGHYHASCAAIAIPIQINDYFKKDKKRLCVQLDLGASNGLLLYDRSFNPLLKKNITIDTAHSFSYGIQIKQKISGELAGCPFHCNEFYIMKNMGGLSLIGKSILGSVGMNFFKKEILVLDYIHNKFLVTDNLDSLPIAWRNASLYEPLKPYQYEHIIPVQIGDTVLPYGFLDTGSGTFDLVVSSRKLWERLTGRKGDEPDNEYIRVNSWGKKTTITGAKMKNDTLKISHYSINSPTIWFWKDDGYNDAIIGNNPFVGKGIVVIDLINHTFAAF